ncbi:thioredoxin fold domain-containing protein [Thiomonas sp. FB-6]|uniref:thioredoxin fold domain-containing protein n=1 Tax=Thiomonas sp. FB-6 TaxID=1158291 RepID=UPI0003785971|nr:thioredoxin fold domain-containing protein [Thiomonas sp. FB-6]
MSASESSVAPSRAAQPRRDFAQRLLAGALAAALPAAARAAGPAASSSGAAGAAGAGGDAAADTPLPAARELRAEARAAVSRGQPLVLMFSLPGCTYCEQLRRSTYRWLLRDGVPVEQLDMVADYKLGGFDGRPTDGAALAARYGVHLAPTVLFLGADGREIGERLVGAGVPDFYGAFVDRSLAQARKHLQGASAS